MSQSWSSFHEGMTQLLIPSSSLTQNEPSKFPAFFNPAAKFSRDLSILIYRNSILKSKKKTSFVDCLSGVGSRGLRVANEIPEIDVVAFNDFNLIALQASKASAVVNNVYYKCTFSNKEVCAFLNSSFDSEQRGSFVDLDPFGSPSPYIDCVLRSVENEGIVSITATDTAVLLGVYPLVCYRKYYGVPLRTKYSVEVGVRLLISNIALIASRFDLQVIPIFAHSYRNYIRVYCKVVKSARMANRVTESLGYIKHCFNCGHRELVKNHPPTKNCDICQSGTRIGGPMWIGRVFDKILIDRLINDVTTRKINTQMKLEPTLRGLTLINNFLINARNELDEIPFHFLNDEFGKLMKTKTLSITKIVDMLQENGHQSSLTIFSTYGFKTNANQMQIKNILYKM